MNILVNGPQGSGKTTQAKLLAEKLGSNFVDSGSILRESFGTELGKKAKEYMDKGVWVPEELYFQILKEYVNTNCDRSKGFILTGIPRTIPQIAFLENELGIKLDNVIELQVSEEEFMRRIEKRRVLENRTDEAPEAIKSRLNEYKTKTGPVLDHYRKEGKVIEVNGEGSVENIFAEIQEKLRI